MCVNRRSWTMCNIPHDEGIKCMEEALNTKNRPDHFDYCYKFVQKIGTAMGTRLAPVFANIFMAMIEIFILIIVLHFTESHK